jgi:hypothetical protein
MSASRLAALFAIAASFAAAAALLPTSAIRCRSTGTSLD